ncbi:hypothetical protein VTK56DRAFT_8226 [Thermocarpiscus australiensis]
MCFCIRAAFLLLVVGSSWEGSANTDMTYAGSNDPPKNMQAPCCSVTTIDDTGRWYRVDRCGIHRQC